MNNFSDKEYQNLRSDTAEIRSCITRYIGYIIAIAGFSGLLKYILETRSNESNDIMSNLLILAISIVIITFFFEIIWYKFKSHNRFVGYMQLLMQEIDAIPIQNEYVISEEQVDQKDYIKNYKKYLNQKPDKGLKDFYSWEFVMSRLHGNFYGKREYRRKEAALIKAIGKTKFVFSVPDNLYPYIELDDHDQSFFEGILFPQYLRNNSLSFMNRFRSYFRYLYTMDAEIILDDLKIDKRYVVNGWRYPKKITQIGFTAVFVIYAYFLYTFLKYYIKIVEIDRYLEGNSLGEDSILLWTKMIDYIFKIYHSKGTELLQISELVMASLLGATTFFFGFWVFKYVRKLKDLVYGRDSIDFYCWMFLIYRTQMLNDKGLVPVFFSRSFIRYFKTNLYSRILFDNLSELIPLFQNAFYPKSVGTEEELEEMEVRLRSYNTELTSHRTFEEDDHKKIHKVLVESFKAHEPVTTEGKLIIPPDVFQTAIEREING